MTAEKKKYEFMRIIALDGSTIYRSKCMTALNNTTRVSIAEIFVDKSVLGSGYLDLMDIDASSQDDLVMTLKSKHHQSLPKHAIQATFRKLSTAGTVVNRIRLCAYTYE